MRTVAAMGRSALRAMLDPGASRSLRPTLVRVALGALFLQTGSGKFVNHDAYVRRFERWGLPAPEITTYATGSIEVVMGLLLIVGWLVRPAALLLIGTMTGAVLTAGRVDGGRDLWLPPLVAVLLAGLVRVGGGRLQVARLRSVPDAAVRLGRGRTARRAPPHRPA